MIRSAKRKNNVETRKMNHEMELFTFLDVDDRIYGHYSNVKWRLENEWKCALNLEVVDFPHQISVISSRNSFVRR